MDIEVFKGMLFLMFRECVDDFVGLFKNIWFKMDLMSDVLGFGWFDGSNGDCSCLDGGSFCWGLVVDGGFWDVCFKMVVVNLL